MNPMKWFYEVPDGREEWHPVLCAAKPETVTVKGISRLKVIGGVRDEIRNLTEIPEHVRALTSTQIIAAMKDMKQARH